MTEARPPGRLAHPPAIPAGPTGMRRAAASLDTGRPRGVADDGQESPYVGTPHSLVNLGAEPLPESSKPASGKGGPASLMPANNVWLSGEVVAALAQLHPASIASRGATLSYVRVFHEMFRHLTYQLGGFTFATSLVSTNRTDAVLEPHGSALQDVPGALRHHPRRSVRRLAAAEAGVWPEATSRESIRAATPYLLDVSAVFGEDRRTLTFAVLNPSDSGAAAGAKGRRRFGRGRRPSLAHGTANRRRDDRGGTAGGRSREEASSLPRRMRLLRHRSASASTAPPWVRSLEAAVHTQGVPRATVPDSRDSVGTAAMDAATGRGRGGEPWRRRRADQNVAAPRFSFPASKPSGRRRAQASPRSEPNWRLWARRKPHPRESPRAPALPVPLWSPEEKAVYSGSFFRGREMRGSRPGFVTRRPASKGTRRPAPTSLFKARRALAKCSECGSQAFVHSDDAAVLASTCRAGTSWRNCAS